MNRRETVSAWLALGAAPLVTSAQQQGRVWRVGFLATSGLEFGDSDRFYAPFRQGMRDLGYVEGKNLALVFRTAEGKAESLPRLAAELVALKVDAMVAVGTTAISAAQAASSTIPIVMATAADPVASGFVKSLSRPGGNITGLSNLSADLSAKQLELLRDFVPRLASVGLLFNGTSSISAVVLGNVRSAAKTAGVRLLPVEARTAEDIERAFVAMSQQGAGAVIVPGNVLFTQHRRRIVELARKHRLPSIYIGSDWVEVGGLMSYGPNRADDMRRAATYVDRIFKGAHPGDLPVEQPTKVELVINRNTARTLGVTIPQSLLVRADRMIE